MEKQRKIKSIAVVALVVAVLGLTVAFAALSQTLTINGTANVNTATWDVHFANLTGPDITGTGKSNSEPTLDATTIDNVNMSVTKPGDSVTYYFDIVNAGTIDAILDTDLKNSLFYEGYSKCSGVTSGNDSNGCLDKYDFDNSGDISSGDLVIFTSDLDYAIYDVDTEDMLSKGDVIEKGTTKHCKLVLAIKPESSYISSKTLTTTDRFDLVFVQK